MFTGIIEKLATIGSVVRRGQGARLVVRAPGLLARTGESIAVDGACLTALAPARGSFAADLSAETLRRTTFGDREAGERVNLERSLRVGARIEGHFVLGHVDAVGAVKALEREAGGAARLVVRYPVRYHRLVVEKGSIAVNGVSLTIAGVEPDSAAHGRFSAALIPHTLAVTNLGLLRRGSRVNLEFDYLAKVVSKPSLARRPGKERHAARQHR